MAQTSISAHVLDTALGVPAKALLLTLQKMNDVGQWETLKAHRTNGLSLL